MISFGSIVQRSLEILSMLEPAAPSEGMPAAAIVAPTSLASRPVSVRLRAPKLSSQLRDVISTLLTRQITDCASTEIFVLGVKPNLVLPRNRRAMTRLSNARTAGECCAITAAKAKPLGPLALPGAADAVLCMTVSAKAGIKAGIMRFFIGAASVRNPLRCAICAYGTRLCIKHKRACTRACTHKIAIGDTGLINARCGPLCGPKSDISEVREVPEMDSCTAAQISKLSTLASAGGRRDRLRAGASASS